MSIPDEDLQAIAQARALLENPGLAVKLTDLVGKPIEKGFELLPPRWRDRVGTITRDALNAALGAAIASMGSAPGAARPRRRNSPPAQRPRGGRRGARPG